MIINILTGLFFGFACSVIGLRSLVTEDEFKNADISFENNKKLYIKNIFLTGLAFGVANKFIETPDREIFMLMAIFLTMASATDFLVKIVQDRIHIVSSMVIMIVLYINNQLQQRLIEAIAITAFMIIIFIFSRGKLGGADVKIFFPVGLSIGLLQSIDTLLMACVATIIVGIGRKVLYKKNMREWEFPFLPYIYLGFILSSCINIYSQFLII